jgi:hypothetical protein
MQLQEKPPSSCKLLTELDPKRILAQDLGKLL